MIGDELRRAREKSGLSQEKLGFEADIHRTYVSLLERNLKSPTVATLFRICEALKVRPSRLSGVRRIVDIIFSYTHRQTGVTEKYFVRVDVTGMFPSVVTGIQPFYDR